MTSDNKIVLGAHTVYVRITSRFLHVVYKCALSLSTASLAEAFEIFKGRNRSERCFLTNLDARAVELRYCARVFPTEGSI